MLFGFSDTKPCRIIWKLRQQVSVGTETHEIGSKVGTWTCPSCPKSFYSGYNRQFHVVIFMSFCEINHFRQKSVIPHHKYKFLFWSLPGPAPAWRATKGWPGPPGPGPEGGGPPAYRDVKILSKKKTYQDSIFSLDS